MNSAIEYFQTNMRRRRWMDAAAAVKALPEPNIFRLMVVEHNPDGLHRSGQLSIRCETKQNGTFETLRLPFNQPNMLLLINAVRIVLEEYAE